jgi:hypothetical protein
MSSLSLSHDICELCNCSEAKKKTQVKLSKLLFVIAIYTVKSGKSIGSDRRKKTSPVNGVYISQLIRYSRAIAQYNTFMDRAQLLTQMLLKQGYVALRLKSSLQKFYCRHPDFCLHRNCTVCYMESGYRSYDKVEDIVGVVFFIIQ